MVEKHISATDAARTFSDIVNRVAYRGEHFIVERGGEPVCRIVPVGPVRCSGADLVRMLKEFGPVDPDFAKDLRAIRKSQPRVPRKSPWPET